MLHLVYVIFLGIYGVNLVSFQNKNISNKLEIRRYSLTETQENIIFNQLSDL